MLKYRVVWYDEPVLPDVRKRLWRPHVITTQTLSYSGVGTLAESHNPIFPISASMTGTGTSTIVKLVNKFLSMTSTPTATILKTVSKIFGHSGVGTSTTEQNFIHPESPAATGTGTSTFTEQFIAGSPAIRRLARGVYLWVRGLF